MRTSGGTLGLVASSPNGSPGASASTVNSTALMPSKLGKAISSRRIRYWRDTGCSCVLVPVGDIPGVVVPATDLGGELSVHGHDARAGDDRDHHRVADDQVVQLDQQRGPLHRVELDGRG